MENKDIIVLDENEKNVDANSVKGILLKNKQRKQRINEKKKKRNEAKYFNLAKNIHNETKGKEKVTEFVNSMDKSDIPLQYRFTRNTTDDVMSRYLLENKVASWDDVHEIYEKCRDGLLKLGTEVIRLTEGLKLMDKNYLEDFETFNKSLNILASDMKNISDQLADVKDSIEGKKGIIVYEEELMDCYDKYQKFTDLIATIDNVLMPTVFNLSSAYQTAYDRFAADNKELLEEGETNE